ncbi:hypothetical protein [Actinoplanes sp. NPDC051851]|uniref:hypothetical protein n=1 Tax=Actinoplanes sp. NPDC051851 TaxID=3154753 RepID=UPI00344AAC7B
MPDDPADAAAATRRVAGFAAVFGVVAVVAALVAAHPSTGPARALLLLVVGGVGAGSLLGLLISWLFWAAAVRRRPRTHRTGHVGYAASAGFVLSLIAAYILPGALADPYRALTLQAALRVLGVATLIGGVLHTRRMDIEPPR